jgi:catechol 2,3-dioxygenase-like lactoylglutathione lyase family enzyme
MIERLDHVNLVVADIERVIAFYRDVLGLELTKRATIRGDWIEAVTGLEDVEADVAFLEAGPGAGIELIHYRRPEGTRPEALAVPNTQGIRHLALRVRNIDAYAVQIEAAGAKLLSPVQLVPADQVDYAAARKRIAYLLDPEGNLVELCSFETGPEAERQASLAAVREGLADVEAGRI